MHEMLRFAGQNVSRKMDGGKVCRTMVSEHARLYRISTEIMVGSVQQWN